MFDSCFHRLVALFALLLGGFTWRLWIPQADFPQVPFFEWGISASPVLDWLAVTIAIVSLLGVLFLPAATNISKCSCLGFVSAITFSVLLDQHRFQPWVYQFCLLLIFRAFIPQRRQITATRILLISIYGYSAIGKLDYQFLHTVGLQFLDSFWRLVRVDATQWHPDVRVALVFCFPLLEFCIALGLVFRRSQKVSLWLAIVMHVVLMGILGPLGLRHEWGVVLWNFFFIMQAWILLGCLQATRLVNSEFEEIKNREQLSLGATRNRERIFDDVQNDNSWRWTRSDSGRRSEQVNSWFAGAAYLILAIAVVFPLGERFGFADHWPSWGLYAPHSSRVRVEVARSAIDRLPSQLQTMIDESSNNAIWVDVPTARWSLEVLHAPIYPQARFQLGVAELLAERLNDSEIRATELSAASRWTGQRSKRTLDGRIDIRNAGSAYWFNAHPRIPFRRSRPE